MATSKYDATHEIAWLIEIPEHRRIGEPPYYWGTEEGKPGWTCDVNEAFRYPTKDKAELAASGYGILEWIVVEHAWEKSNAAL